MSNYIDSHGNYTGYEINNEDSDYLMEFSAPNPNMGEYGIPPEIDFGVGFAIRNQNPRPSCRGHSLAACGRMGARLKNGGPIDLDGDGVPGEAIEDDFSPLWCWVKSQVHGGTVGARRGATMHGGIKAAMEDGFAREVLWPYSNSHTTRFPEKVITDAATFRFKRYSVLKDEPKAFEWLSSGQGPLEWGTGWPFSWVGNCLVNSGSAGRGGHATAIRGYWTGEKLARLVPALASTVKSEPYVYVCENSHGTRAQYKGLYFVTRRGMANVLRNRSTQLLGWSDLENPLVRICDWATARMI